ncbi:MAG TPA: glycosyltransferase, partial [Solirubrobacteraceae bacterium]|nr:glycosyltransferase [Solirubrobacteraceae bacterium]
ALAAREAGADVRVVVLHRLVPPRAALRGGPRTLATAARDLVAQPGRATLDGLEVRYVPFVSPPRPRSYGSWGAWAAPVLDVALRALRRSFPFDLLHAHNAVPAGDAVLRTGPGRAVPLVLSVHGGDVFHTAPGSVAGERAVRRALGTARMVLANSAGTATHARELGAGAPRVVHLGTDLPARGPHHEPVPTVVTLAHLDPRKRHEDVLRALWLLRDRHPRARHLIIGDGPRRQALERLARELDLAGRVELTGQLAHPQALERARRGHVFAMPSVDEAFGVAYVEAMAAGLPAIGARGEPGPEEIARLGGGLSLVAPGDVEALAARLDHLLGDEDHRRREGQAARLTVERHFTWAKCGRATVAAYHRALGGQ